MAADEEAGQPVAGELISSYGPIESARFTALHSAVEIAKTTGSLTGEISQRVDVVLDAANRLFAWLTQDAPSKAAA
jgi:hypothetical protein